MMNMIELQDKLKNFSQEQLVGMMQQPSGDAPQFMVLGEITRRQKMQQEATKAPTQSVAQEAVSAAGVPQGGIADMARTLAPQTNVAQNTGAMSAPPQGMPSAPQGIAQMASGGVIKLAPGGVTTAEDLQKLRSDRGVRDSAERYGMEVDDYIDRMSDGEKRFIVNKPKNEGGIDTAGAPDNELTDALATSRMGAKFANFLDSVGQTGIDAASAALRKTGGTGIKMDARLGMAMAETAAFLGFPEQAAEWQTESQKEMDYGNKMLDGDIGLFGQDRVGFQVPEEGKRLIEAARIAGKATEDVTSVRGPDGYLPASIIQSRRMAAPEYPIAPEASPYQGQGRGGDPFIDQQEMFIPSQDTAHQGLDSITTPEGPFYPRFTPSVEGRETGLGAYKGNDRPLYAYPNTEMRPEGPARIEDVMTEGKRGELEGLRRRRDEAMQVPEGGPYVPPNPAPYAPYIGDAPVNDPRISRAYKADEALTPGEIISGSMEEAYGPSFGNIGKGIKDWWNSEQGPSFDNPPLDMDAAQLAPTPEQMNPEKTTKEKNDKLAAEAAALLGGATTGATGSGSGSGGSSNYETKLLEMLSRQEANAKSDKWMALAQAGMSLMQGGTGSFGGDLGRAGQTGLAALQGSRASNDKSQLDILGAIENSKLKREAIAASATGKGGVKSAEMKLLYDMKQGELDRLDLQPDTPVKTARMKQLQRELEELSAQYAYSITGKLPTGPAAGAGTGPIDVSSEKGFSAWLPDWMKN
jgi:hypothetical protein